VSEWRVIHGDVLESLRAMESGSVQTCVLDPFNGSGTTGLVCIKHQRRYVGIELNPEYVAMSERRLSAAAAQGVLFAAMERAQ
jgi:hypothetical protein